MSEEGPRIEIVDEVEEPRVAAAAAEEWGLSATITEEDGCVYAKFPIPKGVSVKGRSVDVVVEWAEKRLKVVVKSTGATLVDAPLRYPVRVPASGSNKWDSCETRWFVEDDKWFVVQLEKQDKSLKWGRLFTVEYYQERAEAGSTQEQLNMAFLMDQNQQPEAAFAWFKRAADEGNNAHAQVILATKYLQGIGTTKDEEKMQEYFIKAALNPHPHPIAMYTVGLWLREGTIGQFGKNVMMGYTHRQIWERCVQLFPTHQQGRHCALLLAQEYMQEYNMPKAEHYARLAGVELSREAYQKQAQQQQALASPQQQQQQQQQPRARPSRLEALPVAERVPEGTSTAQATVASANALKQYNLWSTAAWCLVATAAALLVYRAYKTE